MTCKLLDYVVGEDPSAVIKVCARLGLQGVIIRDPGMIHEHCGLVDEWLAGDEAEGSYLYADHHESETNRFGMWVKRWRGRTYFFTSANTAFAFKIRFA